MRGARPFGLYQAGSAFHGNAHAELFEAHRALQTVMALVERSRTMGTPLGHRDLDMLYDRAMTASRIVEAVMGMVGEESKAEWQACPMCEAGLDKCPIHP